MMHKKHPGRQQSIDKLNRLLNQFAAEVRTAITNNLPNINVHSETITAGLLNRMEGWNLSNANTIRHNFPGIDLFDPVTKIGVQVTSTNSLAKVDHTLEQVEKLDEKPSHLYILILSTDNPTAAMKNRSRAPWFSGSTDIWNIPTLIQKLMNLEAIRLEEIAQYLEAELGSFQKYPEQPYLRLSPSSALDAASFVGREQELAEIHDRIDRGDKLIVLSGLGGMGKTELAVRFGQDYQGGTVYFIRFDTSFTRTMARMANGIVPKLSTEELTRPDEELCGEILEILGGCGKGDILIIDNVDADSGSLLDLMKDPIYEQLRRTELRLILTTRFDHDRSLIGVRTLNRLELYQIFTNHGANIPPEKMDDLINAVNGHTLTIDQMARLLNGKGLRKVTADMLLTALENNTLPKEKYRKIAMDYNQSKDQAQIYQNLSIVFNIAGIPEVSKILLCCATLLPADGMAGELFASPFSEETHDALYELIDHGWLTADDWLLTIHPVIRMVCREELKPSDESCGGFLDALWGQLRYDEFDWFKYTQLAEMFALAADTLEDTEANWLNHSGRLWLSLAQFQKAAVLYEKHLHALENRLTDSVALSSAYNNLGSAYSNLGNSKKALEYILKALAILEKVLPADHPNLATTYDNVGGTYGDLGDHGKALEFKLKALAIREAVLPKNHPDLATSYNNVGGTYSDLGNNSRALEFMLKALGIRETVLPKNHPELAIVYNNVGNTYGHLGDHRKALEFRQKALDIRETVLPEDHPELADSYNNVGMTYSDLGNHQKALEYILKALDIRIAVLPENHPDLAQSYNNAGGIYGCLGDHSKALEYQTKALSIRETVLPENHPALATTYNNIGATYGYLGNHMKALEYQTKALDIFETVLPENHPQLASSFLNVGFTCMQMGMLSEALECNRIALAIYESSLPEGHPYTENARKGVQQLEMLVALTTMGIDPQALLNPL